MGGHGKKKRRYQPEVKGSHEFLEITRDFIDPKDAIREAISNAIDWGAKEIKIIVKEDFLRPDEELIIEIIDDGVGINEERLKCFFDLGHSIGKESSISKKVIGYKGHGTKTFFNSRMIEIESYSHECFIYAIMNTPLQTLMKDKIPECEYDIESKKIKETRTKIKIYGYNMNQNRSNFSHNVLKDYILWFTLFGSVEKEFSIKDNQDKILKLQGLGQNKPETIRFGHIFPKENDDIKKLRATHPGDWSKLFVKRWIFSKKPIVNNPSKFIDIIFYIEGDDAKRNYNPMLRGKGKTFEYGMYKVEDRYGLWVCKDYIPIKQYNEWLGLGKRLETKYHAFVNCQEFRLTANRGDIGNTPPDLLQAIQQTVRQIFEEEIIGSQDYQEYEEATELEQQYQTAEQEGKDFSRRQKRVRTKKVSAYKGIELIEPGVEMGAVALFNQIYTLEPALFPFHIIDYDTKRGYDALVSKGIPSDLSKESIFFIEFKFILTTEFNHSFDHLFAIICWDCNLSDGDEVKDIRDKKRELRITQPKNGLDYTRYMLVSSTEVHNIEVFVLKQYLKEKLKIEFTPRTKKNIK